MILVAYHTVVSMRYTMRNAKGEILENRMDGQPVAYLHGAGAIQPALQLQLEGLQTGDTKQLYLDEGSGLTTDNFIFDIVIDEVRTALPQEIMLGYPLPSAAVVCGPDCICFETQAAERTGSPNTNGI
jgi:FKBP-type peptidyl-prolyl cis-trans isomerase SlyD